MSTTSNDAERFVNQFVTDAGFRAKWEPFVTSPEAFSAQLAKEGYSFSGVELAEALSRQTLPGEGSGKLLPDEELAAVSGGGWEHLVVGLNKLVNSYYLTNTATIPYGKINTILNTGTEAVKQIIQRNK